MIHKSKVYSFTELCSPLDTSSIILKDTENYHSIPECQQKQYYVHNVTRTRGDQSIIISINNYDGQ